MGYYNGVYYESDREMIEAIQENRTNVLQVEIIRKKQEVLKLKKEINFLQTKLNELES